MVLLPDGRVMSYGTDPKGAQTAAFIYDVWDPARGTGDASHMVLPNTTGTNIFCAAQTVTANGDVFIAGGSYNPPGGSQQSIDNTTIFMPTADTIAAGTPMHYHRCITLLNCQHNLVVFGGKQNTDTATPIIRRRHQRLAIPHKTWHDLTGATSDAAFGASGWSYPRACSPGGSIFILLRWRWTRILFCAGNITQLPTQTLAGTPASDDVFAPSKVLAEQTSSGGH
jgi:hypothetical protein